LMFPLSLIFFPLMIREQQITRFPSVVAQLPSWLIAEEKTRGALLLSPVTFIRNVIVCFCWRLENLSQSCDLLQSVADLSIEKVIPFCFTGLQLHARTGNEASHHENAANRRCISFQESLTELVQCSINTHMSQLEQNFTHKS
jgi:hypothetical protein